jgi:hypothetical protein
MLENFLWFTTKTADPISIWIGLLTAIPIFWIWFDVVFGRRKRHNRWFKRAKTTSGRLPAVLIVDLLAGRDISAAVQHFMVQDDRLKEIPDDHIIKVTRDRDITPEDMPGLARDVQDGIGEVLRLGADELFVFLAGPMCASAMVGAELSNISCKVFLYQNDRGSSSTYVNFGPLRHPRF